MSEFECSKGHDMHFKDYRCEICGGRVARMDGKTSRQLMLEEKYADQDRELKEIEENEDL